MPVLYSEHICLNYESIKQKSNNMKNCIFLLGFLNMFLIWDSPYCRMVESEIFITKVKISENQD